MSIYSDKMVADDDGDLLAYWPLDEEWGTTDVSGNGNPAYPGIRLGNGGAGPALGGADGPGVLDSTEFDGVHDFVVTGLNNRTNLVTNPSAETNTTDWAGQAGTLSRDTTVGHTGTCSFKIVSTSGAATTRIQSSTLPAVTAGQVYTLSARIIGKTGEDIGATIGWLTSGSVVISQTVAVEAYTSGTGWQLMSVTGWAPETATQARLHLYTLASAGAASDTGWVDAILFEQNGEFDGYWDGATSSCNWTGTAHASTSVKGPFVIGLTRTFEWLAYRDTAASTMAVIGSDVALTTNFMMVNIDTSGNVVFVPEVGTLGAQWDAHWPVGRWVHGMIVFADGSNAADLYIDGEPHEDNTKSVTDPWDAEPGHLQIGCKGSAPFASPTEANPFDGRIAHVAVYHGDQSALANAHAVLGLSELSARAAPAPWYSAA